MKQKINLDNWNRKEHFLFFKQMDEPFYGITAEVDVTNAYNKAKEIGVSFFSFYLHKTLKAVNAIENFRYRIINDEVYVFDVIDASATIMREDHTFGFSYMSYVENTMDFDQIVQKEIKRVQTTTGIFTRDSYPENLIHFSALPWIKFTALSHARSFSLPDSCPKISFGKLTDVNGIKTMPISVHVHHALVDGYHVGLFLDQLEKALYQMYL